MWNGGRGGRNSNCDTTLQVLLGTKDPWNVGRAEYHTSYVLSGPFSPTQHILLLFSFPHCPLCLPHPLCLLVLKIWVLTLPTTSLSPALPSLPLFLSRAPFPRAATSSPSSWNTHTATHTPLHLSAPASLLSLNSFFSFPVPLQREGSSARAGGCLPALALVWLGPLRWGMSRTSQEPRMPGPSGHGCAATCVPCTGPGLWPALTAGAILGECCNRRDVQESTIFWGCQTWVYFPGDSKGHAFQVLSSKHGGSACHKKTAGKIYSRWIKQCVFS